MPVCFRRGGNANCLVLLILLVASDPWSAHGLRCNTYIGTDFGGSGPGIETCVVGNPLVQKCVQRRFFVLGVRTYGMSCDDLLQCLDLPPNSCCTKADGVLIKCSEVNFNETTVTAKSFLDSTCKASCDGRQGAGSTRRESYETLSIPVA